MALAEEFAERFLNLLMIVEIEYLTDLSDIEDNPIHLREISF
jgi:hypothetical protein